MPEPLPCQPFSAPFCLLLQHSLMQSCSLLKPPPPLLPHLQSTLPWLGLGSPLQPDETTTATATVSSATAATLQASLKAHLGPNSPKVIPETAHSTSDSMALTSSMKDELVSGNVAVVSAGATAAQPAPVPTPEPSCSLLAQEQPNSGHHIAASRSHVQQDPAGKSE